MNKILLILFLYYFLSGCERPASVNKSLLTQAIIEAKIIDYKELSPKEIKNISSTPRYFGENENWHYGAVFDPKKAFYVQAKLNREILANLTLAFSCGTAVSRRACSEKELAKSIKDLFSYKPSMLYGKYHNRWEFIGDTGPMSATKKFNGHLLIDLKTSNDNVIDTVLIGPLPMKPKRMLISFYHGYKVDGVNYDATYYFETNNK